MRNLLEGGDGIHEVLYFKDRASRFLLVSKGWVDAVAPGHGPDEFIGKTDFDVFSEPHARAAFEDEQRIIRTGKPMLGRLQTETYKNRPDEWVLANKQALREDGRIVGTFGISRNVTAQVRAEQEIVRRESQLRAVLDSTPDAIACYGPDLRYEMVNPQAAALLGAAPDEVVGRTDEELGRPTEVLVPLLNGSAARARHEEHDRGRVLHESRGHLQVVQCPLGTPGRPRWRPDRGDHRHA